MVLVNQRVADEIATLVARHRYEVEDARDVVKASEAASAARNEEIRQDSAERQAQLVEQVDKDKTHAEKPGNNWGIQRRDDPNEISFPVEEDPEERPRAVAPPAAPKPSRRRPSFDDDEDFENQTWLR